MIDEKKLKSVLMKKHNYDRELALQTIEDIKALDEDILEAAQGFINTDEIKNITVEPCDVASLIEAYNMNPIGAYIFIDWLRKEPNKALQCLGLGFDEIKDIEDAEEEAQEEIGEE
jgi:hypothetical protein